MNEEYIVIDGLSHIGYNVILGLLKMKKKVKTILFSKKNENKLPEGIEVYHGSLNKKDTFDKLLEKNKKKITYVINCLNEQKYDALIINKCLENKVDKYVLVKSEHNNKHNIFNTELNISYVVVTNAFGSNDFRKNKLNSYVNRILNKEIKYLPNEKLNIIDIEDASNGVINAALYGNNKEVYYLKSYSITPKLLVDTIKKFTKEDYKVKYLSMEKVIKKIKLSNFINNIRKKESKYSLTELEIFNDNNLTIESSKRDLDFNAKTLNESIKNTINYINNNKNLY